MRQKNPLTMAEWVRRAMFLCVILLGCSACFSSEVFAHALGIDKASLKEFDEGRYSLSSFVPQRLSHLITTPQLPDMCDIVGSPRGERGVYEVRFNFSCKRPLSAEDALVLPWQREGALLTVHWNGQEPVTRLATREGAAINVDLADYLAGSGSFWNAAKRYFAIGVEHILEGYDHLLFVLALLLIVRNGWALVKTITAFTVAHSITLALATFGVVNLPSAPVEAAIALSIVFLCAELVYASRGMRSLTFSKPWLVAFAFGLLHGLGFAGALSEIGLPPDEVPVALLFFNIGVEAGQLIFVAAVSLIIFAAQLSISRVPFVNNQRLEIVVVYIMGTIATFWTVERVLSMLA